MTTQGVPLETPQTQSLCGKLWELLRKHAKTPVEWFERICESTRASVEQLDNYGGKILEVF